MTESNDPQLDQLDAAGEQPAPDAGTPDEQPATSTTSTGGKAFALYDTAHLRFVGPVRTSRKDANGDKPDKAERGRYEVREV